MVANEVREIYFYLAQLFGLSIGMDALSDLRQMTPFREGSAVEYSIPRGQVLNLFLDLCE